MRNSVNWFELPASDLDRAVTFYGTILDAPLTQTEFMGEALAVFPYENPGIGGAIVKNERMAPTDKGTVVYLNVEGKLDDVLARTEPAGGKVLLPRTPIDMAGFVGLIMDSEGNHVGLHSST